MTANPRPKRSINLNIIGKKADPKILQLFPSINFSQGCVQKRAIALQLAFLKLVGNQSDFKSSDFSSVLQVSRSERMNATKTLLSLGLIKAEKNQSKIVYNVTTAGFVVLLAFEEFREWTKIQSILAVPTKKGDPLAYALLIVGFCANKPDSVYQALCKYASQGYTLENIASDVAAESLLSFYRQELRNSSSIPPAYLSVFKEFTTAGFQEVFRMLLVAIKPTAEDYNWLVEFFNEVSEFYFDPARIAFINLLPQNERLRQNLEEFKKAQDQQIKKEGKNLEVTFTIPGSGTSKIDSMPPHIRAIGLRLILEPVKFINNQLVAFFWDAQNSS
jgi:hypothetical protein